MRENIYQIMEFSIQNVNSNFGSIKNHCDQVLPLYSFIFAETLERYTECDLSYTIKVVQQHCIEKILNDCFNMGKFELNTGSGNVVVIGLDVGVELIYSGYLLTHRYQIR